MTQVFTKEGKVVPVTIVDINENVLVGKRSQEKHGYEAVIIGQGKKRNFTNAELGKYSDLGYVPKFVVESREEIAEEDFEKQVNKELELKKDELEGKKVSVTGITKGKGFQGVMRRWGFHGGPKTHGQSDRWRAPGSIGAGTDPGRVFKGKKMPGHMGVERKTIKNLEIIKFLDDEGLVLIKGALPGPKNGNLIIKIREY